MVDELLLTTPAYGEMDNRTLVYGAGLMGNGTDSYVFLIILNKIYSIIPPVICVTAVTGNILAFFVFVSKPLRRTSCSWYLAARSVSDSGFLVFNFLTWFSGTSKLDFFHTEGVCQLIVFTTFMFAFMSVWLTVVVTMENYIRICRPFSVQKFCNTLIAKRAIIGLFVISVLLNNVYLWTNQVFLKEDHNQSRNWCTVKEDFQVFIKWYTIADTFTTLIIPSLLIVALMVAITFSLIKSLKRQSRLQGASRSAGTNGDAGGTGRSTRSRSSPQAKVTRMLFAVSFFFLLLNGPSHFIRAYFVFEGLVHPNKYTSGAQSHMPTAAQQAQVMCEIIFYLCFAVNLIIYLTCGDSFRKQFKDTYFSFCCRRNSPGGCSEMTAMSTVRLEEMDNRNEDQTALIETSPTAVSKDNNNVCS